MPVTARQLNRATLERQLLLRRGTLSTVDAVRRVVCLQAQEAASPYLALWARLADFDASDLDAAFARFEVIKASLMRITLHAVRAADYPLLHEAMQPTLRAARLADARFKIADLSIAEADALVAELLDFAAQPRTNADFEAWLDRRLGVLPRPGVWWALRSYAPFVHAPTGGPWSFGPRPAYVAAPDRQRSGDPDIVLKYLVRRYLEGFGPASIQDIAQFALVQRARARAAVEALNGELVRLAGPGGAQLFDVPAGTLPDEDTPAPPRLLPMWDSVLLAYFDRSRVIPAQHRRLVIRNNGDVLPALLVDGYVAGVWRPVEEGIEATAFEPLSDEAWTGLAEEAVALRAFVANRDPAVYRRFGRWWANLPSAEVLILR